MGGERRVNHRIVLVMCNHSYHTLTQMCLHIVNTYMPIDNDTNLQCTTHIKGNPYKCKEQYYTSLCFAAQTNFLLPPT